MKIKIYSIMLTVCLLLSFLVLFSSCDMNTSAGVMNAEINENGNSYNIGAIYEHETIKYLCYAVKSTYNQPPPTEIGKNYQWLPLDKEDPLSDGYYVVFQDALDFKILEL